MRDDIKKVRDYYISFPADAQALDAFKNALTATGGFDRHPQEREVDRSRFRVSRFFVRLRKLSNEGYLERHIIATALSRAAIEDVFLNDIDPLDQIITQLRLGRDSIADRDFYRGLLVDMKQVDKEPKK